MRVLIVGVALLLVAHAAFAAAIEYEFVQTSRSPNNNTGGSDFTARAVIDGPRSRVEFRSGTAFPPGTYVISSDGSRRLQFVDPSQKTFTEVNTLGIASAIGTSNIQIENFKQNVVAMGDTQMFAGLPAEHFRQTITYDITVRFGSMPLKQAVRTEIDKWTTTKFGDMSATALSGSQLSTGNPTIDELISAETTKIKGFPLKQTIKISTTDLTAAKRTSNSELKLPPTRIRTRELTVTSIRETTPNASWFLVPAEYKRIDFAERAAKSQMQVLSTQPASE
jgi:hypothetical protein